MKKVILMGTNLQTINHSFDMVAAPVGSLDAYIQRVNQVPMLSAEEEYELAARYHQFNDLQAARQLVLAHLRFVVKVARGYAGYGLALADLIQEGTVGLMKAVKRFDPNVGVRLVSFAVHWIKAEMHEFIIRNWRIVKVATTKAQRKLFFNLRKSKKRLGWFSQAEVEEVANELGVSTKEVLTMEARLNAYDAAFDGPAPEDNSNVTFAPAHYLEDQSANPALQVELENTSNDGQHNLHAALQTLDARSQDILQQRWLSEKKVTLHDLAAKYKVSAERIRQLEANAMKKLKAVIAD